MLGRSQFTHGYKNFELNLPAVIGVGEILYKRYSNAQNYLLIVQVALWRYYLENCRYKYEG